MLKPLPRIVAVDYGTRRVGLAIADPMRLFATPLGTYTPDEALGRMVRLAADEGLDTIVVGWPLDHDGEEGLATRRVLPYFNRLRKAFPKVSVVQWDERGTSRQAVASLVDAGVGRKRRRDKGRIDRAAAAVILQEYLDEQLSPPIAHDSPDR